MEKSRFNDATYEQGQDEEISHGLVMLEREVRAIIAGAQDKNKGKKAEADLFKELNCIVKRFPAEIEHYPTSLMDVFHATQDQDFLKLSESGFMDQMPVSRVQRIRETLESHRRVGLSLGILIDKLDGWRITTEGENDRDYILYRLNRKLRNPEELIADERINAVYNRLNESLPETVLATLGGPDDTPYGVAKTLIREAQNAFIVGYAIISAAKGNTN